MQRLTQRDPQGNWCLKGVPWEALRVGVPMTEEVRQKLYSALWKLKDYENTGLTPSEAEELRWQCEKMRERYQIGMPVHRQGDDESDAIECPHCGFEVARNDDFHEMRPNHCPNCGTKLIY